MTPISRKSRVIASRYSRKLAAPPAPARSPRSSAARADLLHRDRYEGPSASATRRSSTQRAGTGPSWWAGRPLADAVNAHSTNTKQDLAHALDGPYNFLEGDVRTEINPPYRLEMRHDKGHESGDNLYLDEWLKAGAASGRGLKLDVKEGERMPEILDAVERAGVPDGKLMFNIGDGDAARWGTEIRRRFPDATIALNPTDELGGRENSGPLEGWQVTRMLEHARAIGGPTTFVVRQDRLTDAAIGALEARGPVSVWNAPSRGGVDDVDALTGQLRERGVTGVIDLRASMDWKDKLDAGIDKGKNLLRDYLGKLPSLPSLPKLPKLF